MSLWFKEKSLKEIQYSRAKTMIDHLGIEFVELTPHSLIARMPVDERTKQPYGILHGGASAALAETVGSVAANLTLDPSKNVAVGLDINTSHIKRVKEGHVTAEAKPVHLGKQTQVWQILATNDQGQLVSISRLTMMVLTST